MITLLNQTMDKICEHAKETFPEECCGAILSSDSQEHVRPCRNIQNQMHKDDPDTYPRDARTAYIMHPDDLIEIHNEANAEDRPIKAFYHSHPNHEAYFSEKDQSDAIVWGEPAYPGVAYIVISIFEDTIRIVKAFSWDEETSSFIEVQVETEPSGA